MNEGPADRDSAVAADTSVDFPSSLAAGLEEREQKLLLLESSYISHLHCIQSKYSGRASKKCISPRVAVAESFPAAATTAAAMDSPASSCWRESSSSSAPRAGTDMGGISPSF